MCVPVQIRDQIIAQSTQGYQCCIVNYEDVHNPTPEHDRKVQKDFYVAMHWAVDEIRKIQKAARSGKPIDKPRPPMIFMRTPKGWTGPRKLGENPLVDSFRSHQVPLPAARDDKEQFKMLQDWLASYHPESLFNADAAEEGDIIKPEVLNILPQNDGQRLGQLKDAYDNYQALDLPDNWKVFATEPEKGKDVSPMKATALYLEEVIKRNPHGYAGVLRLPVLCGRDGAQLSHFFTG